MPGLHDSDSSLNDSWRRDDGGNYYLDDPLLAVRDNNNNQEAVADRRVDSSDGKMTTTTTQASDPVRRRKSFDDPSPSRAAVIIGGGGINNKSSSSSSSRSRAPYSDNPQQRTGADGEGEEAFRDDDDDDNDNDGGKRAAASYRRRLRCAQCVLIAVVIVGIATVVATLTTRFYERSDRTNDPTAENKNDGGGTGIISVPTNPPTDVVVGTYKWTNAGRDLLGADMHSLHSQERYGHMVAVSGDGTMLAIGSAASERARIGLVDVFHWNGTDWTAEVTLRAMAGSYVHSGAEHQGLAVSRTGRRVAFTQADVVFVATLGDDDKNRHPPHLSKIDLKGNITGTHIGVQLGLSGDGRTLSIVARGPRRGQAVVRVLKEAEPLDDDVSSVNGTTERAAASASSSSSSWIPVGQELKGQYAAIDSDGTRIAVGRTGSCRVYALSETDDGTKRAVWNALGQTLESDVDGWGEVVTISDDGRVLAVGTGKGRGNSVSVYQYSIDTDRWEPAGGRGGGRGGSSSSDLLLPSSRGASSSSSGGDVISPLERFGADVKLNRDGTVLVVGAPGSPDVLAAREGGTVATGGYQYNYGRLHVFQYQEGDDLNTTGTDDDGTDGGATSSSVSVSSSASSTWKQMGETLVRGGKAGLFGSSVAISAAGDRVVAGAPGRASGDLVEVGGVLAFDWKRV